MTKYRALTIPICVAAFAAFASSCSTTSGDAAFRSGHYEVAAQMYRDRAAMGDPVAAYKLATRYDGTNWTRAELGRDEATAIIYYKRAYELGHITAPGYIGAIYEIGGRNVAVDFDLAQQWYEKGAKMGQHASMYALAGLYSRSLIRPPDDVTGLMWAEIARQMASVYSQNEGTRFILEDRRGYWGRLRARMNDSDIAAAVTRARDFVRSYKNPTKGTLDPRDWTQ
jgi:TPR repeat protein